MLALHSCSTINGATAIAVNGGDTASTVGAIASIANGGATANTVNGITVNGSLEESQPFFSEYEDIEEDSQLEVDESGDSDISSDDDEYCDLQILYHGS